MRPTFYLIFLIIIQSIHRSDAKQRKPQARKSCAPLKMEQKLLKVQLTRLVKNCQRLQKSTDLKKVEKDVKNCLKLAKTVKNWQNLARKSKKCKNKLPQRRNKNKSMKKKKVKKNVEKTNLKGKNGRLNDHNTFILLLPI